MKGLSLAVVGFCSVVFLLPLGHTADYLQVGKVVCRAPETYCLIVRQDTRLNGCESPHLLPGDIIESRALGDRVQVHLDPYAELTRISAKQVKVLYKPPRVDKGMFGVVTGYFQSFFQHIDDSSRKEVVTYSLRLMPRASTMLSSYPLDFFVNIMEEGPDKETLVVEDLEGNMVLKKEIQRNSSLKMLPQDIGMKRGASYVWRFSGRTFVIRLLDEDMEKMVLSDLNAIDARIKTGQAGAATNMLEKAAYCQILSDMYPEKFELYWLSYQMLPTDSIDLSDAQRTQASLIRDRAMSKYAGKR